MPGNTIDIRRMILRYPGLAPEEADSLAQDVVSRVQAGIGEPRRTGQLDAVRLQVQAKGAETRGQMAQRIADAILKVMQ